jgi:hypothetical protein
MKKYGCSGAPPHPLFNQQMFCLFTCHPGVPQDDRWNNFSNSKELIAKKN